MRSNHLICCQNEVHHASVVAPLLSVCSAVPGLGVPSSLHIMPHLISTPLLLSSATAQAAKDVVLAEMPIAQPYTSQQRRYSPVLLQRPPRMWS